MTCATCTTSGCGTGTGPSTSVARREPCPRLACLIPSNSTCREITRPTSKLGPLAHEVEQRHGLTWQTVQTAAHKPLPDYSGISARDMALLRRIYEDGATHEEVASEFNLEHLSVRVVKHRIIRRLAGMLTIHPKVRESNFSKGANRCRPKSRP